MAASNKYRELKIEDFAKLFGTTIDDIPAACKEIIASCDFRYKILDNDEYDSVLFDVLRKIDSDNLTIAGEEKKVIWESGWRENLQNFIEKGYNIDELTPKYYRPGQSLRIYRKYSKGNDPNFEYNFFKVLRSWLFMKYFINFDCIYEFGCGPGHNLVALAKLYPEKKIFGFDWAKSSVELVNKIALIYKLNMEGNLFDMFQPDKNIQFNKNSIVFTMGALEQLGHNYQLFLNFILKKKPSLCIHVEPFIELYDENNFLDYIAIKNHKKRNLLGNYIGILKELESQCSLEILKIQRVFFGGPLADAWSFVIWRPK